MKHHEQPVPRSAAEWIPADPTLERLRVAASACQGCDLYRNATQTVFGEGPAGARLMLIGEQPGDQEDRQGRPFVGPAGKLLDRCLEEAGLARGDIYLTNVVKHFKWIPSGTRRLHKKPGAREIEACQPWLEHELALVQPEILVLLGATAAQALLGKDFRVTVHRGQWIESRLAPRMMATVHPSALLRAPDEETRHAEVARFMADLRMAAEALSRVRGSR